MKKILSLFIILAVVLSSVGVFANDIRVPDNLPTEKVPAQQTTTVVPETPKVTFSDVDANTATGKSIYKLVNAGILNGYEDGTFRPNNPLTRAELCKIVNLVFNYTEAEELTFSDVKKEDWYYNYVAIAKKAGYITGHADGTFKGNDYLTREQTCTIVSRVAGLFDIPMTEKITDTVSEWAVPYVNKVVANKLMPLEEGGKFRATENITRAELVSVMSSFVVEEQKPSEETTVTQYTVTFNTNGGSSMVATKVDSGKTLAEPGDPTKTGYTFAGWYTDSALTKPYDFNAKVTANITLYAKWTKATSAGGGGGGGGGSGSTTTTKYTVTFNTNGGSTINSLKVESGKTVSKPADPTKSGYTFAGWYTDSGLTKSFSFSTKITGNITLYAKWTANSQSGGNTPEENDPVTPPTPGVKSYDVTFMSNGSTYSKVSVETGNAVDEPAEPERDGYRFDGWYKDSACKNLYNFSTSVTKHITLYAKWTKVYTVTFETNGGEYIEPVVVDKDSVVDQPDHGEWPGYYFLGWYKDADFFITYDFSKKVTADLTLYAKWIEYDESKQQETVEVMSSMLEEIVELRFDGNAATIMEIAVEVMTLVLEDAANGKLIYDGDYILDNYGDKIGPATEIYHKEMTEDEQVAFYSYLVTELGEERADNLLQIMFGISLEDAKDKVEN